MGLAEGFADAGDQVSRRHQLQIEAGQVVENLLLALADGVGAGGVIVVERGRFGPVSAEALEAIATAIEADLTITVEYPYRAMAPLRPR